MPDEERNQHTQAIKAMLDFKIDLLIHDGWNSAMNRPKSLGKRWAYWKLRKTALMAAKAFVKSGQAGQNIRTVQELLGHADVSTTRIDTHMLNRGGHAVRSPLDRLEGQGR